MSNPLMQAMSGAQGTAMTTSGGNPMASLGHIMQMLRSGNPEQIAQQMMQSNPQFKAFVESNRGKTPEQVAQEHGMDLGQIIGQLK